MLKSKLKRWNKEVVGVEILKREELFDELERLDEEEVGGLLGRRSVRDRYLFGDY